MEILKIRKQIVVSIALVTLLASCSNEPSIDSVISANESIEFSLDTSMTSNETDPLGVCETLSTVSIFYLASSALMDADPEDIKRLDSNLEILSLRMEKLNLENSENAKAIAAIRVGLSKIKLKSSDSSLYDGVAKDYEIFSNQQLDSYCYDWYVSATTSDEDSSEDVETTPQSVEGTPQNTSTNQDNGYWKNNCTYVDVPNPNYDARKGFSAVVNEPTIRTQQCSQIWVDQNTSTNQDNGYWKNNCTYVDVPNPNYDARKGFSAVVNEPTIRTQQCSQVWVNN